MIILSGRTDVSQGVSFMSSLMKFFRWFTKCRSTDSKIVSESNCHSRDSVMQCLDVHQNVRDDTVEHQPITATQHGFDWGRYGHTSTLVSAVDASTDTEPETTCNEAVIRTNETCLTHEFSQHSCHIQTSQNTQSLTTKFKASISNSCTCDAFVNYDNCTDHVFSSSRTFLSPNPDFPNVGPNEYSGLTAGEIALIESDIEVYLNRLCPATYYDFCLITCEIDYEEATAFRSKLCRDYNLMGCMLFDDDFASVGRDIFEQYEAMMNRSTKIFFYHTENCKKDDVHRRVQNGAVYQQLWEQMCKDKDKCVPVFPNGSHRLGLALSGISGLHPTHPWHMHSRVLATFTDRVRKVRMLKEANAKKRRSVLYKELCEYVAQCYKERIEYHLRQGKVLSMNTQLALSAERARRQELQVSPVSNVAVSHLEQVVTPLSVEVAKNIISKLVSERYESGLAYDGMHMSDIQHSSNNSCSGVHISESSNIHVGPRIEVNVHVSRTKEGDSCYGTGSHDGDVETKIM